MDPEVDKRIDQLPLLQKLFSIGWESGAFSDVTLSAFGREFQAHRILLCQSPYFERLLRGHWSDSKSHTLELSFADDPHIGAETFLNALQFLYGRVVHLNEDNVIGTLAMGCFLGLEPLCDRCVEFVSETLSLKNFEKFYLFCSRFDYGVYSRRLQELCLDFLLTHSCWEARPVVRDLSPCDARRLLTDDVLWTPTEVERLLMIEDTFPEHYNGSEVSSPAGHLTGIDEKFKEAHLPAAAAFTSALNNIRFEHFPEVTLRHLMKETHSPTVTDAIQFGYRVQSQFRDVLGGNSDSIASKISRNLRAYSKAIKPLEKKDLINRSFRVGIEFLDLSDIHKTKGLDSYEYFYAGSLWRVHAVQRRKKTPGSNDYIGIFVHRRPAPTTNGSWSDQRSDISATLRVRMGWGSHKVDKTCHGRFEPDSWNSYGWPQFIRTSNLEKCKQPDGALRLVLNITLDL